MASSSIFHFKRNFKSVYSLLHAIITMTLHDLLEYFFVLYFVLIFCIDPICGVKNYIKSYFYLIMIFFSSTRFQIVRICLKCILFVYINCLNSFDLFTWVYKYIWVCLRVFCVPFCQSWHSPMAMGVNVGQRGKYLFLFLFFFMRKD